MASPCGGSARPRGPESLAMSPEERASAAHVQPDPAPDGETSGTGAAATARPLVTVLIPAYNARRTIERALRSVLIQDYAPLEIIVVDDASTDDTAAVAESLGIKELRLIRLPKNLGECGAMNAGLAQATGRYIAFLDADDEWLPSKLNKQIPLLEGNSNMAFATCGCLFVDSRGAPFREFGVHPPREPREVWRALLAASCVAKPCVVARTSVIRATDGFDLGLRVAGDQDMWIRLAAQGEVGFVEELLVIAHDTPGSLTKVHAQRVADYVMPMVERNIARLRDRLTPAEIRHIRGERYAFIGRNLYTAGMRGQGLRYLARSIAMGNRVAENAWYVITASPPAQFLKSKVMGRSTKRPAHGPGGWSADASLLAPARDQVAEFGSGPPILNVVIDTEAEFEWSGPFRRDMTSVENLKHQERVQSILARHGVRPTYVVAYAVAAQEAGYAPLRELVATDLCTIGAHLQPWENPPFDEGLGQRNSFVGNLPFALQKAKLEALTRAIEENFLGRRPVIYKAGRYGVSEETGRLLAACGYEIDLSVLPARDMSGSEGPDFQAAFNRPYWFGPQRRLLEIPMTAGLVGALAGIGDRLYHTISDQRLTRIHIPGIFARLGLLERITLTPEGVSLEEMKRLTRAMLAAGHRVFTLSYHSPSVMPGNTPYVRNAAELEDFIARIEGYLDFFFGTLGGTAMTPTEIRRLALEHQAQRAA